MIHRFRNIGLVVAATLTVAGLFLASRPREPIHEGRRLSEWLGDLSLRQKQDTEEPVVRAEAAAKAIQQMGTNCLPLLLGMLEARDSRAKEKLMEWAGRQSLVEIEFTPASERRYQALQAFAALGPAARSALPALTRLLWREPSQAEIAGAAAAALACLGAEAVPTLAGALTNSAEQVQLAAIAALANSRLDANEVLPVLFRGATHTNPAIRSMAIRGLGLRREKPELWLPILLQAVADPAPVVQRSAIEVLPRYQRHGQEVASTLIKAAHNPSPDIVQAALHSLSQIAPADADLIVPALISKLDHADTNTRDLAVWTLGQFGSQALLAIPALLRLHHNGTPETRAGVARALAQIKPDAAALLDQNSGQTLRGSTTDPRQNSP